MSALLRRFSRLSLPIIEQLLFLWQVIVLLDTVLEVRSSVGLRRRICVKARADKL